MDRFQFDQLIRELKVISNAINALTFEVKRLPSAMVSKEFMLQEKQKARTTKKREAGKS